MTAPPLDGAGPARRRRGPAAALALGVALAAGCGPAPEPPRWVSLAQGLRPRTLAEQVAEWERAAPAPTGTRTEPETLGLGLHHDVAASDWRAAAAPDTFTVELPAGAFRACGIPARLIGRGREYTAAGPGRELVPGEVRCEGTRLVVRLQAKTNFVPPSLLVLGLGGAAPAEHPVPSSAWQVGDAVGSFWLELPKNAD